MQPGESAANQIVQACLVGSGTDERALSQDLHRDYRHAFPPGRRRTSFSNAPGGLPVSWTGGGPGAALSDEERIQLEALDRLPEHLRIGGWSPR
jgi:hypothetical protein